MATSLSELRKNRAVMYDRVTKDIQTGGNSNFKDKDTRFWTLTRDKTGNGSAIIRFLPAVNGDALPWVRLYSYGFKSPIGKWYINDSPMSIDLPDPVADSNRELYATKNPTDEALAKTRKRKTHYIANIVVIKDPANPENNGKTFLYKFGTKIHEMITSKASPEFEDDKPIHVYDIWEGCDFKLRIKTVKDYPNYDSSEFSPCSELLNGDEELQQKAIDSCYRLSEFQKPEYFKTYDVLKAELDRAMRGNPTSTPRNQNQDQNTDPDSHPDSDDASTSTKDAAAPKKIQEPEKTRVPVKLPESSDDTSTGDDSLDYFKSLLSE